MVVFKVIQKQFLYSSFFGDVYIPFNSIFIRSKDEAKKIKGKHDVIREFVFDEDKKFIFELEKIGNMATPEGLFLSKSTAIKVAESNIFNNEYYNCRLTKYKLFNSAEEFNNSSYKPKQVFEH